VGGDFEDEYPGASALATECYANLYRTADMLMELHNRHTYDQFQLSPSARQVLAVVEGADGPLEPSIIAKRLLVTTGSMTSLLDNLEKRGLIVRRRHPDDRRKVLIDITPTAQAIVDELLPAMHSREREVMATLTVAEQHALLDLLARLQQRAADARVAPPPQAPARRARRRRTQTPAEGKQ
jgi:DNA-binding MarR family transcriptional regulator